MTWKPRAAWILCLLACAPATARAAASCDAVFGSYTPCSVEAVVALGGSTTAPLTLTLYNSTLSTKSWTVWASDHDFCPPTPPGFWASILPPSGSVPAFGMVTQPLTVFMNATGFGRGAQHAFACVLVDGWSAVPIPVDMGVDDVIFDDGFEAGLGSWSASATDGGDLSVSPAAAVFGAQGLQAFVNDTAPLYVEDDTPADEPRYRARFYLDANDFDPGEALNHLRTRVLIAFSEAPNRRLAAVVLKRSNGAYALMGRARNDDNSQTSTPFFPITAAPHAVEVDLVEASAPGVLDGTFELWIDGVSMARLTGLDNSRAAVDFARLGALSVKEGASGTLHFDAFGSRRQIYLGPIE